MKIYNLLNAHRHIYTRHRKSDLLFYFKNQGVYKPAMQAMPLRQLRAIFYQYVERLNKSLAVQDSGLRGSCTHAIDVSHGFNPRVCTRRDA